MPHYPHRFNELAAKSESGMGSPNWNVSMVDIHLRKLLWVYCSRHTGVKGNDRADRLVGKAILTSGLLLERSEVMRSLKHYLRAQSQGHSHHRSPGRDRRGKRKRNKKKRAYSHRYTHTHARTHASTHAHIHTHQNKNNKRGPWQRVQFTRL